MQDCCASIDQGDRVSSDAELRTLRDQLSSILHRLDTIGVTAAAPHVDTAIQRIDAYLRDRRATAPDGQ